MLSGMAILPQALQQTPPLGGRQRRELSFRLKFLSQAPGAKSSPLTQRRSFGSRAVALQARQQRLGQRI
jgi:hypothetical protein